MAAPGQRQGAEQLNTNTLRFQPAKKVKNPPRRNHRPGGVRTRRTDADLENFKNAEKHARSHTETKPGVHHITPQNCFTKVQSNNILQWVTTILRGHCGYYSYQSMRDNFILPLSVIEISWTSPFLFILCRQLHLQERNSSLRSYHHAIILS